jgi:ribosomal protein S18 acetylase RimI-like enzyme
VPGRIRPLEPDDLPGIVDLSLRAWAPVFGSLRTVLGDEVFLRLHPDWRASQERAVTATCTRPGMSVRVADEAGVALGFVAYATDDTTRMGVIEMLAVDPARQGGGIGTALTTSALDALRSAGMLVAMVETGGDPGHAPARRTYERAGCTLLPVARYVKALDPPQDDRVAATWSERARRAAASCARTAGLLTRRSSPTS